ncbi:MAG: PAS domain-containing protein [Gammaproteobacteria bacterium]|nr:PAS domain-containing protein [Gammaproteobacteria bacterium]
MKPAPASMHAASSVAADPLKLPGAGDNARRIFERAREMIYLRDGAGRFTFVNRTGVRWLGLGNEQLLGRSEVELFDGRAGVNYRSWGNDAQTLRSGCARQFEECSRCAVALATCCRSSCPYSMTRAGSDR